MRFAFSLVLVLLLSACSGGGNSVALGEEGILEYPDRSKPPAIPVYPTKELLNAAIHAANVKDSIGFAQALATAYDVAPGTRVLVIDYSSFGVRRIRILEGPHAGKAGYVPMEWVRE